MVKAEEVASFLAAFKEKMKIWDVLFRDERGKNTQALIDLELRPADRLAVLESLEVKDYSEGPLKSFCIEVLQCGCLEKSLRNSKCILRSQWD